MSLSLRGALSPSAQLGAGSVEGRRGNLPIEEIATPRLHSGQAVSLGKLGTARKDEELTTDHGAL